MIDVSGKRVWVIGAGGGIGEQVAMQFFQLGADVIAIDKCFGDKVYPFPMVQLDISNSSSVSTVCEKLLQESTGGIDVLVNAAGVLHMAATEELSIENWQHCFDVNVSGAFYLFRQLIPLFKKQGFGSIVCVASNAAHLPRMQMSAYCASKSALVSLSHCVGLELSPFGVRCNVVSPGSTDTSMLRQLFNCAEEGYKQTISGIAHQFKAGIPLQKIATTEEVANTIIFLASDLASHITLQDIVVDGGATLGA